MKTVYGAALGFAMLCSLLCWSEGQQQTGVVTCAYASWATYRRLPGRVMADEIPAQSCTHAVYLYAALTNSSTLVAFDPYNDLNGTGRRANLDKFMSLKSKNPRLKTLIGVGGWNAGGFVFSQMAMQPTARKTFIDSVIGFCKLRNLNGILIDWLVPGVGSRGGDPEDYKNFPTLLKEMKAAFKKELTGFAEDLLVAITVSADVANIDYYDTENLNSGVDLYYLVTYDYYGPWNKVTYHHAPLFNVAGNYSVDASLHAWLKTPIDKKKLGIVVTTSARSYIIPQDDSDDPRKLGVRITGDGRPGPITASPGSLGYVEVCRMLATGTYTSIRNPLTKTSHSYSYDGDMWFSYENEASVKEKANYVINNTLGGGIMVFTVDLDDPHGYCGVPYPLTRAIRSVLSPLSPADDQSVMADLSSRVESRCLSQQPKPGGCEVTLRCPRISTASFSPGELDCPDKRNCTFATGGLDCVVPVTATLNKANSFYMQSGTSLPATFVQMKCSADEPFHAENAPNKWFRCHDTGFSGEAVEEFSCSAGYKLRMNTTVCING